MAGAAALAGFWALPARASEARFPTDAAIRAILADRIDVQARSVGIAVGVVEPAGRRIVVHGGTGGPRPGPVGARTDFEIASLSKVFTALALADSVVRGEVRLDDPAAVHLPGVRPLKRPDGGDITLTDLATHASGLPMWPPGATPSADLARIAAYSADDLAAWLAGYAPVPETRRWAYSNVAVGLLGQILARRAGVSFNDLVRRRIAAPLGMTATAVAPPLTADRAYGHFPDLRPAPAWKAPAMEGAASIHSTAADMVRFLEGCLGVRRTRLDPALRATLDVRRPGPEPGLEQALGWLVAGQGQYVQFSGATAGFAAFMAFHPTSGRGVVVLSNSAAPVGDIANHLIRPNSPLSSPPPRAAIAPAQLAAFAGLYDTETDGTYAIVREDDRLLLQAPNLQMLMAMVPLGQTRFYVPQFALSISFVVEPDGAVSGLIASQGEAAPIRARRRLSQ